jgi:hypothetical protein
MKLSEDPTDLYMHTPSKTLLCLVSITGNNNASAYKTKDAYKEHYSNNSFEMKLSEQAHVFESGIIYNDYDSFATKVAYAVLSV